MVTNKMALNTSHRPQALDDVNEAGEGGRVSVVCDWQTEANGLKTRL